MFKGLVKEAGSQEYGNPYGYVTAEIEARPGHTVAGIIVRIGVVTSMLAPITACVRDGEVPQATPIVKEIEKTPTSPPIRTVTFEPEETVTPQPTETLTAVPTDAPTATQTPVPLSPDFMPEGLSGAGGSAELSPSQKERVNSQWESWEPYVQRIQVENYVSGVVGEGNPTGLEMRVATIGLDGVVMYAVKEGKVIFPNTARFKVGENNQNGLDLPAMPNSWTKGDLVELNPGATGEYVAWSEGMGTFVSVTRTGGFSHVYKGGDWVDLTQVDVPNGVDANVWRIAVTMGGVEGATWDEQLGTVVWPGKGDETPAWDNELNYIGKVVGSGSGRLVARHNFDKRPSSAESGGASFDYQGNFTGLGVDTVKYVSQEGITQASIGFTSKVIGFERLIIDPLVNNTNDLFGLKGDDIAMWDTVVLQTVVNGAPTKVHVLLRPDGVPKMDHIIEDGSGARPSDVANIFSTISLGDVVFYYTSVVTEAPIELDFCNLRVKSGERQYQVWQAVGAARIVTSSTRRLGLEIDGDGKSWCQPLLMDNDIDILVKSVGPLYPGGYWTIARK